MVLDLFFLVAGGTLLYFGGDWLVDGVSALAHRLRVPAVMVALIVMGFGTSAPELVVAIKAMLAGVPDIAMGNVLGSNIANVLLVLALAALVTPIAVDRDILRVDGTAMMVAALALWFSAYDGIISRLDAALLVVGMLVYLGARWCSFDKKEAPDTGNDGLLYTLGITAAALISLPLGAHIFVAGATSIATTLGVSEAIIGLTVVALGTSLPEIAACLAAAIRREPGMILGGVLGSNVFNSTVVIAGAAAVANIPVADVFQDFWIVAMIGTSLITLLFLRTGFRLNRLEAMVMLALYGGVFLI